MSTAITVKPSTPGKSVTVFPQTHLLFEEMEDLVNKIRERAFGLFQQRGYRGGNDLDDWFRAESELLKPVPIEISESKEGFTIRAKVPGFEAKDLTVRAEPNSICIHGKSEQKKEEKVNNEVEYNAISRSELCRRIDLPHSIDPDKVSARMANGILDLELPKAASPRKIEVKAA